MHTVIRNWIVVIAIALLGLETSGCPALMVPSLAYQGYKYEKKDSSSATPTSKAGAEKRATPSATPSLENIE